MNIVAIVGSPRVHGNTNYLTDQVLEEAGKLGLETTKFDLTQYQINPCQGHDDCQTFDSCPQRDDAELVLQALYEADGVILASPVYFFNVTAQLKALMDRSRFYRRHKQKMRAKCIGIITVAQGGGSEATATTLLDYIKLTATVPTERVLQVHALAKTEGEIASNTSAIEQARRLGRSIAEELLAG